ncbi:MAG: T9SS C-terminal target domain-containing protein [Bacteroidetes bacterium]|nr:MAG: T9SS C-terminal target domain-containing protein [Bacteroidota bacterium]REK08051.1 MAG: T9SS C-terminal target domain-containing protein [Bacteroidota bacterium]REK32256.1 MAG: T9SS C-terminal target domain-containing protein [Bacteroidota bacterium]REK47408.1 MAG: T9SS C-terminal target domain-containing protein [Bacteroidota bacterium]
MKKILLIVSLFLVSLGVSAQGVWVSQATGFTPVSSGVRQISPVDTNVVWIVSYDGSGTGNNRNDYSRTVDGGSTWVAGSVPVPNADYDWAMMHAISADTAWALLYFVDAMNNSGGGLWKTVDGGATWTQQGAGSIYTTNVSFPNIVHFWDADNGVLIGDPTSNVFEMYTTTDGGTTWTAVPSGNIPAPLSATEYGIVGHYDVKGDTIWWDTNAGRVLRSVDRGLNWTVSSTGIIVPANGAIDIVFRDNMNGLARLYNSTNGTNTVRMTSDGGDTWTAQAITGNMFGSDIKHVPGTNRLVSTGAATGFIGSSYSDDGGITWVDIETQMQRTALGIVDSVTMWCGGFTSSPTAGGIFKWQPLVPILCNDANITPGTFTGTHTLLCFGDTVRFTSTGMFGPNSGTYSGAGWIISQADLTGNSNPLNDPSVIATYAFQTPAPANWTLSLVNDGAFIDGGILRPYGVYYWTPVVFGNATSTVSPPTFLHDLTLDPSCTYTGASVMVDVTAPGDPRCATSVYDLANASFSVLASLQDNNNLKLTFNALAGGKSVIEIFDITGKKVLTETVNVNAGNNVHVLNVNALSAGTYVVKMNLNADYAVTKFFRN